MFSGLVEQTSPVLEAKAQSHFIQLVLERPSAYVSLKEGESVSVDGICLTLENFDKERMTFSLGPETLKITGWTLEKLKNKNVNLERSLTLQSAIGGHLLTGHVDGLALVKQVKKEGRSLIVQIEVPKEFKNFFLKKGYIALNGVSLTINDLKKGSLELCLIPKTLQLTNLSHIKIGDWLNFEVDYISRFFVHGFQNAYKRVAWLSYFTLLCAGVVLFFLCLLSLLLFISS